MSLLRFRETTNPDLSGMDVGICRIFEREFSDGKAVSAELVIHDPRTGVIRREIVRAGSVVEIGGDRYEIVSVELVAREPGWISLRRV